MIMANPPSAAKFLQILKDEGVKVVEVGNWATHNRAGHGPWGPVYGVIIHHTVTKGTASTVNIVRDGYASLPGPLCHGMIAKDGTVYLVGYGRANHAGGGDPAVLEHVIAEDYGDTVLKPKKGNLDGVDGNRAFYGFECENLGDGKDPWPEAQLLAIEKVGAAICRYHKWGKRSVIGHLEWSDDKVDPRGFGMVTMRNRIGDRLAPKPVAKYHTVVAGDTMYSIAKEHSTTVTKLHTLNPKIKNDIIVPGDPVSGKVRYA
jgi:hypothetical protein